MNPLPADKPKHFIVLAIGSAGDIYPMLRIALALQQRGHQVTFLCPEHYAVRAEQAGASVHSIIPREDFQKILDNPHTWHPRKSIKLLFHSIHSKGQQLIDLLRSMTSGQQCVQECVLITHPLALSLVAIVRATQPPMAMKIRVVAIYLAPANLRTTHDPLTIGPLTIPHWLPQSCRRWLWRYIETHAIAPAVLPDLNLLRLSNGLEPVTHFFDHWYQIADLSVTCFPVWFAATQPDWPQPLYSAYFQLYDPQPERPQSAELTAFLANGEKPIVFTPGTGNLHAKAYFQHAMQASLRLGRRAIFLTGFREQLPASLPDSILWQEYVPLRQLLPQIAALVHHGGIGTTAEALRAGVPQLVVPLAHDQFDNGARVNALGVGYTLPASRMTARKMTGALDKLLNSHSANELLRQCRLVAARFVETDDEEALCRAMEKA